MFLKMQTDLQKKVTTFGSVKIVITIATFMGRILAQIHVSIAMIATMV